MPDKKKKVRGQAVARVSSGWPLKTLTLVGLGLLPELWLASGALAEPAAYWRWRSTADGQEFCIQTPPGSGWTQVAGPFRDLQCREPGQVPLRRWAAPPQRTP